MLIKRLRTGGRAVEEVAEEWGNVFAPDPARPTAPVYSYGPSQGKARTRDVMFTCPVSAIPAEVFDLLSLWNECRLLGLPPVAGGVLDQPMAIRVSFRIFAREWDHASQGQRTAGAEFAAATATMATLQALFGKAGK